MDAEASVRHLVKPGAGDPLDTNAEDIERDLRWFATLLDARLQHYFAASSGSPDSPRALESAADRRHFSRTPAPAPGNSDYGRFVVEQRLSDPERLVVLMTLIPYIRPQLYDVLLTRNSDTGRGFTEFGGHLGNQHGGLLPTVETALFIFAGDDLAERFRALQFLHRDMRLVREGIIRIVEAPNNEPWPSSALQLNRELVARLTAGQPYRPSFGVEFPARLIHTSLTWDYLVLPPSTLEQLQEIRAWIVHGQRLLDDWGMRDKLTAGFTSLFFGPPGTGKTLSACLLGKYCDCEVYKVDLSMVVSKYIGETEKNLARVFDEAEHRRWILFFDEADALFGKRTNVDESRDRYANQEISFLLQRIEEFHGVVILASNFKSNIDDAFMRRFQSVIQFSIPKSAERLKLWQKALPAKARLEPGVSLPAIAEKYDVAGGTIMNVVRFAALRALMRNDDRLLLEDIDEGMRREYLKEGRRL